LRCLNINLPNNTEVSTTPAIKLKTLASSALVTAVQSISVALDHLADLNNDPDKCSNRNNQNQKIEESVKNHSKEARSA